MTQQMYTCTVKYLEFDNKYMDFVNPDNAQAQIKINIMKYD